MKKNFLKSYKTLKGNLVIKKLIKEGIVILTKYIKVIYSYKSIDNESNKISVFISKKYLKKSIERNLVKRLIKESFRLQENILHYTNNTYYIIFIYKDYKIKKFNNIKKYIKKILYLMVNKY